MAGWAMSAEIFINVAPREVRAALL
ncbi:MAG: hypothetical protein RLZZ36_454, partial [Pseudomonadota bacterium]